MQEIQVSDFERTTDGQMAHLYRITNASGASVVLCDYGASVVSILVPDKQQNLRDVVLGYAHLSGYETGGEYFGASVGRCCNRIREGAFTLNGVSYQLAVNDGTNHLHGGNRSFSRRLWNASCAENRVIFQLESPDGEEQYPGNMQVTATYTWDDTNTLTIAYDAICDQDTLCNLTNHTYFQLDGEGSGSIEKQQLLADARKQADAIVAAGKASAEAERQSKLREADAQTTALARAMCEKLLARNLTAQDDARLLDDLLEKAGAGNGN